MGEVSTIGLDIAKSVFQVHGVDDDGTVVVRKRVSRAKVLEFFSTLPSCVVGIEACPSAHHWSRELRALGHTVRLMPPSYVKAYLKRSKNDVDATAQPSCSRSLLTRRMVGYPRPHGSASMFLPVSTPRLQQRSELSRSASMPGIVQAKKAAGSNRSQALVPSSTPPWSQTSVTGPSCAP